MEPDWASQHLQVIRTLMERSAIYRRALAPIMLLLGAVGVVAAIVGWSFRIESGRGFVGLWLAVSVLTVIGAYMLARRQALRDGELFWSPPTRRVTQALLPPLAAGALCSVFVTALGEGGAGAAWFNVPLWMSFYGCALHAAGFFTPRGIKLLGWLFVVFGGVLAAGLTTLPELPALRFGHLLMGLVFGGIHLSYGGYLYFTERRKNET